MNVHSNAVPPSMHGRHCLRVLYITASDVAVPPFNPWLVQFSLKEVQHLRSSPTIFAVVPLAMRWVIVIAHVSIKWQR